MGDKRDKDPDSSNERTVDEIIARNFGPATTISDNPDQETADKDTRTLDVPAVEDNSDSDPDDESEDVPSNEELDSARTKVLELKESGNKAFRNSEFEESIRFYCQAIKACRYTELHSERAILYSNRAASEMKLNNNKAAIHSASRAIKLNPGFSKAYLRRAKAHEQEDKLDESLEDFKKVLELDPSISPTTRREVTDAMRELMAL